MAYIGEWMLLKCSKFCTIQFVTQCKDAAEVWYVGYGNYLPMRQLSNNVGQMTGSAVCYPEVNQITLQHFVITVKSIIFRIQSMITIALETWSAIFWIQRWRVARAKHSNAKWYGSNNEKAEGRKKIRKTFSRSYQRKVSYYLPSKLEGKLVANYYTVEKNGYIYIYIHWERVS